MQPGCKDKNVYRKITIQIVLFTILLYILQFVLSIWINFSNFYNVLIFVNDEKIYFSITHSKNLIKPIFPTGKSNSR